MGKFGSRWWRSVCFALALGLAIGACVPAAAQQTFYDAYEMGLVNQVVELEALEEETVQWSTEMLDMSPMALRMIKASCNAADDGLAGIQQLAGDATLLFYQTEEAQYGRDSYPAKEKPDFSRFPRRP